MEVLFRGTIWQRLRLATGLVLMTFALTHFLNHAVGLVSLDAMEAVQEFRTAVSQSLAGSFVLIGALLIHPTLGVARFLQRHTLRMPWWELVQVATGLLVPLLLIPHAVVALVGGAAYDLPDEYGVFLLLMWPAVAVDQSLLLLLVWVHGCIGMHFWLRLASGYRKAAPYLLAIAVAVPILALTGFLAAGREALSYGSDPAVAAAAEYGQQFPTGEQLGELRSIAYGSRVVFLGLLVLAVSFLVGRQIHDALGRKITISYLDAAPVVVRPGPTLLEISRMRGIPHTSVCGGRARCSTCRVRVEAGLEQLPAPSPTEFRTLQRIGAPPKVRLACQIRPVSDIEIVRLVPMEAGRSARRWSMAIEAHGVERRVAIMFLDVRGFTRMSQSKLPYDVVFVLNRLFGHFGRAIEAEGGWIDKYLGDGLLAVFGRDAAIEEGGRQALRAAAAIDRALEKANAEIIEEVSEPLAIGIGIHAGPVVLGEIGAEGTAAMTVIGRTVNTAARLEAMTKELECQLVVSTATVAFAGLPSAGMERRTITVRGDDQPIEVVRVERARDLPQVTRPSEAEQDVTAERQ